jgi:hypothetical protein
MSYPFIIWTMQRTGGTSLAELLMEISEHRPAQHEPFNWQRDPRQFAYVSQEWAHTANEAALFGALGDILSQRYLIKHCYELHPMAFNLRLMAATASTDYRHLHLLRRDEFSRLASKFVAEANGTWFKDYADRIFAEVRQRERSLKPLPAARMVEHYRHCREAAGRIGNELHAARVDFEDVFYEDLYLGSASSRQAALDRIFSFLELDSHVIAQHRARIENKIFNNSQETGSVLNFVPNLAEVEAALTAAGCPRATATPEG